MSAVGSDLALPDNSFVVDQGFGLLEGADLRICKNVLATGSECYKSHFDHTT